MWNKLVPHPRVAVKIGRNISAAEDPLRGSGS